ncbi:MAG: PEP-CTERM sorting domain-containing protein [bacterium]|nr:PEP-CTERM sorting domain-containing protein [bacterium]
MNSKMTHLLILASVPGMLAGVALADHAHEDIIVGHTSGGQLAVEFAHFAEEHVLALIGGPGLFGWLGDHPGFAHLEEDEPAEDLYTLAPGAEIWFEVVAFDNAFQAWGPGFTGPCSAAGDQALLGDEELHEHMNWHVDSADPLFEPLDTPWEAQFRLIDNGTTGYADSPVYTLSFVPEPGTASLLIIGAVGVLRRRRT